MSSLRDNNSKSRTKLNSPKKKSRGGDRPSARSYSVDYTQDENEMLEPKAEVKIIVGKDEDADVLTITEALELAEPGTVIKITEGRYKESIRITKPGIRIEPRTKEKDKAIYLFGEEGPSITVDLKANET
jgi:hypothetical protein